MRVIVIRHHAEDSAGFIAEAFQARGAELSVHLFPDDGPLPPLDGVDHVVVLGAISSVYDEVHAGWVEPELDWLRSADESGVPVLGICFGAQALCTAFGGKVVAAARKEIGWTMISPVQEALVPAGPWLQFHGDRCEPPGHATILASNEIGVQAFSIGRHLAVQFHPEVDGEQLGLWLEAGGRREVEEAGQDPDAVHAQTIAEEPAARARADRLVGTALRLAQSTSPAGALAQ
ncbi:MAG TPA: gamma-glutamyl-gamma-aminobutyrate hydrolase family protein [Streptosporangiaceae bacterium]|nr:gamma-glutamyl-gamma-aminobutyrate hydrolase family protein [Streptosporangiaceae bacterium]